MLCIGKEEQGRGMRERERENCLSHEIMVNNSVCCIVRMKNKLGEK